MKTMTLVVSCPGFDHKLDKRIEKLVKREDSGSGYSFHTGKRDLEFDFKVEKAAKAAMARVRAAKIRGVSCKLWYNDED